MRWTSPLTAAAHSGNSGPVKLNRGSFALAGSFGRAAIEGFFVSAFRHGHVMAFILRRSVPEPVRSGGLLFRPYSTVPLFCGQ